MRANSNLINTHRHTLYYVVKFNFAAVIEIFATNLIFKFILIFFTNISS